MRKLIENGSLEIFNEPFEFIDSGAHAGDENMRIDLERTGAVSRGEAAPMFRIYSWKPWCVSLGYNQKEDAIDKNELDKFGFDLTRRPTGGRAVLHADELTYSVVTKVRVGLDQHKIYKLIHEILLSAFKKMNPKSLGFTKSQANFREFYKTSDSSVSCFASAARYEIEYEGRKVVGSAQRLFGGALLQHGSILLDAGHELLADVSYTKSPEAKEKIKKSILAASATLSEVCKRKITREETAAAVKSIVCG